MSDFQKAFEVVLAHEGGGAFTDHPLDRGGPTRWGVTQVTLADWRGVPTTSEDVKALSLEEASSIYRARYWDRIRGEDITDQIVATKCFDIVVNMGVRRGSRLIQTAVAWCGKRVTPDGVIGPASVAAINTVKPEKLLGELRHGMRLAYLGLAALHSEQSVFLKGWLNRADWGAPVAPDDEGDVLA